MYKTRLLLASLVLAAATAPVRAAPAASDAGVAAQPAVGASGDAFSGELDALLSLLDQRGLFDPSDPASKRHLLQSILDGLKCGATLLEPPEPSPKATGDTPSLGLNRRLAGNVLYAQLLRVNGELLAAMRELLSTADGRTPPKGLMFDLRASDEGNTAAVAEVTALLEQVAIPTVLIIGHHTSGTSELLAIKLRETCGAVTVGASSTGCPFGYLPFPLPSGTKVLLPEPNGGTQHPGAYLSGPLVPDVPVLENGKLGDGPPATPEQVGADACVRRATDLLVAVNAFSRVVPDDEQQATDP